MRANETLEMVRAAHEAYGRDLPRLEKEMRRLIRQGYRTGDAYLVGAANYFLGYNTYRYGGERDKFLSYAIKSAAILAETRDYLMVAKSLNLLGIAYLEQENYQMALESFNRSHRVLKRHRVTGVDNSVILNNIADCYYEMADYKSSIRIFSDCLAQSTAESTEGLKNTLVFSINLAECYECSGDYAKAKDILGAIGGRVEEVDIRMWVCLYYAALARTHYALGDRAEGNRCADRSYEVINGESDTFAVHKEFEELAFVLLREGEYDRAEKLVRLLSDYAEKTDHTIDQLYACRVAAERCRVLGDAEGAMAYYSRLDALYKKRLTEIKSMQLTVHKKLSEANSELRRLNRRVAVSEERATRDPLTKLLNRASLLKVASEFIDTAEKHKEKVGAVFLDIDFFKECNDTYGHARGDEIIRAVASACAREETASIRFARYGGDEFFGISHGLTDDEISDIARRICTRIREADIPNAKNCNGKRVTLSVGLVNVGVTARSNTIIDIANFADKALYHAKDNGKDAIYLFDYGHMDADGRENYYVKVEL
ncbi:MAG: GGDEF domain-containing protein [Oscillospiraceae bacterium]|nr:GGDEF domain-containing protein [Oscillospiraceae bacterium]